MVTGRRTTVRGSHPTWADHVLITLGCGAAALAIGFVAAEFGSARGLTAALIIFLLLVASSAAPRNLLLLVVVWLTVLGTVRRVLPADPQALADPLLLVGPIILGILGVIAVRNGALKDRTPLSNAVLILGALTLAGAVNPLQGSVFTGLAGLLFFFVPQIGFWIGRGLCDEELIILVTKFVAALAPLAALYGLAQSIGIFPSWDKSWIKSVSNTYQALFVGGAGGSSIRAFATFSAWAEYAAFIAIGLTAWLNFGFRRFGRILSFAIIALLSVALVLESERTIIISLLLALALTAASRHGLALPVALVGGAALLLMVPLTLSAVGSGILSAAGGSSLVQHVVQGLANPLGASTLPVHFAEAVSGFQLSLSYPLGLGIGAVSIASGKFGGVAQLTEVDPSNAAVALGIPGILVYTAIVVLGIRAAYRLAVIRQSFAARLTLGIPVLMLLGWLNGGQYAVAFLPWLALGWVDRVSRDQGPQKVQSYELVSSP
jgi:hypothetical protein